MKRTAGVRRRARVLGKFMRAFRERRMITQGELARATRLTAGQISRLEAGEPTRGGAAGVLYFLYFMREPERQRYWRETMRASANIKRTVVRQRKRLRLRSRAGGRQK